MRFQVELRQGGREHFGEIVAATVIDAPNMLVAHERVQKMAAEKEAETGKRTSSLVTRVEDENESAEDERIRACEAADYEYVYGEED